jgi:predicted CDP-diglyceride synthetase/phosphatidate cytidylyltransferase
LNKAVVLAFLLGFTVNSLALYGVITIIKRLSKVQYSTRIERSVRKAYISRKKREAVSMQIKRIRSEVFRLSVFQFIIPFTSYILALILYMVLTLILFKEYIAFIPIKGACLAPLPIEYPESLNACSVSSMWIHFLIFILYLPLYDYYVRKYFK